MSSRPVKGFINAGVSYPFIYMIVDVETRRTNDDSLVHFYETDLADSSKRRVFAEQMSECYAANQYSIVVPKRVQRRIT